MLLNMLTPDIFPAVLKSPINCGAFAMLAGLVIVPVVSLITPKLDRAYVDKIFTCFDYMENEKKKEI